LQSSQMASPWSAVARHRFVKEDAWILR